MAMHIPRAPGFAQMMKDGSKHYSGLDEAVYRNIEACKELAKTLKSAYGPHGQNKMVINHLDKLFVTNDAATVLRELEVQHPAAKMIVMASQQQEQEAGDGTNFVIAFAGSLCEQAEELLRMGVSVTEVISGYEQATKKALEILPSLECGRVKDLSDRDSVTASIKTAIMSKQYGHEDFLSKLVCDACLNIMPDHQKSFNVDRIRVCKIMGSGVTMSSIVKGMVFKRIVEGEVNKVENAKIAVYSCPLDVTQTETKGTVTIKTAQELKDFSTGEEDMVESQIKAIADTGCKLIVTGGKVGDLALHYCNKYNLMVLRLLSKFDLRRLCQTVGATALPRITPPTPEEAGYVDHAYADEIGEQAVVVIRQEKEDSQLATIVIRGSTDNLMDDIERAVDDGVNTFKALTKDNRLVPGGGASEIELAKQITSYGETCPGLEQYAIEKFAQALETMPTILADNLGVNAKEVLSQLYAAHQEGKQNVGVDVEAEGPGVCDAVEAGILDLYLTKYWAIKFASQAACTVLRVDQIIMAKQAGGPKPRENKDWDEDD
ncbi:T-complex protein 1 subunit theta-like [Watersipora subatra]|uniref:T-complex protein 1 subunit theta-like n=1 Tax=Watersipora subatra TaxID=2589382 RepID=UPI00355B388D